MGWFVLPVPVNEMILFGEEPGLQSREDQPLQFRDTPRMDREWEILSLSIPELHIFADLTISTLGNPEAVLAAEYINAWRQELGITVTFQVLQSGLSCGSISQALTLTPTTSVKQPTLLAVTYQSQAIAISQSLQNPITVRGPEKVSGQMSVSMNMAPPAPFVWEHEEGTGESKHSVKTEIKPGVTGIDVQFSFGREVGDTATAGALLYISEQDKEQNGPTAPSDEPPLRPASIPM